MPTPMDRKAVGVVETKPEGVTLSGVADQAAKYSVGLPSNIPHVTWMNVFTGPKKCLTAIYDCHLEV